jgi:hypothetical protein
MTLTIVTSFNKFIWNNHAKTCIESWLKHLYGPLGEEGIAPDYQLHLYIDGPIPADLPKGDNIKVHWLDNEPEYVRFLTETRDINPNPNIPPEHKFRFEFRRFWPKVFAIKDAAQDLGVTERDKHILWLDADILLKKDLPIELIVKDATIDSIVCLDRGHPWNYIDSGYLLLHNDWEYDDQGAVSKFTDALYNIYTTKTIFKFTEWHDAFLMSQVFNILWGKDYGDYVKSLSGRTSSLHPLDDSWLSEYMVHLKGQLKSKANEVAIEAPRRQDV